MDKRCNKCKLVLNLSFFHIDKEKSDGFRTICITCVRTNNKVYKQKNKEKCLEKDRQWRTANRERHNASYRKRYQESIECRLKKNLRNRLVVAIKQKYTKTSAVDDLGCSIEYFKNYLESKFQLGMTWSNWGKGKGKWNIDHIIPLASVKSESDLKILCHYTNLQPLWWNENLSKGVKLG